MFVGSGCLGNTGTRTMTSSRPNRVDFSNSTIGHPTMCAKSRRPRQSDGYVSNFEKMRCPRIGSFLKEVPTLPCIPIGCEWSSSKCRVIPNLEADCKCLVTKEAQFRATHSGGEHSGA